MLTNTKRIMDTIIFRTTRSSIPDFKKRTSKRRQHRCNFAFFCFRCGYRRQKLYFIYY
uniref:Uncharacterized protein n=1 Tax=Arundo donax TaxID=35708 RepID=A0A0A9DVV8_ARUDO